VSGILARYEGGAWHARLYRRLRLRHAGLPTLAALLPPRGLVVDLGCGAGLLAHLLVAGAPERRVLAVDHDAGRVEALRRSTAGLPIEVLRADMTRCEVPSCAGVALVDVLHYLPAAEQETLVARAAAALEQGGVLLLRDPDAGAGLRFVLARWHERLATGLGFTRARLGRFRDAAGWCDLLARAGLDARALPLVRGSPYADRTVVGRKP
jgi:SAM-dependent methyltransferase